MTLEEAPFWTPVRDGGKWAVRVPISYDARDPGIIDDEEIERFVS